MEAQRPSPEPSLSRTNRPAQRILPRRPWPTPTIARVSVTPFASWRKGALDGRNENDPMISNRKRRAESFSDGEAQDPLQSVSKTMGEQGSVSKKFRIDPELANADSAVVGESSPQELPNGAEVVLESVRSNSERNTSSGDGATEAKITPRPVASDSTLSDPLVPATSRHPAQSAPHSATNGSAACGLPTPATSSPTSPTPANLQSVPTANLHVRSLPTLLPSAAPSSNGSARQTSKQLNGHLPSPPRHAIPITPHSSTTSSTLPLTKSSTPSFSSRIPPSLIPGTPPVATPTTAEGFLSTLAGASSLLKRTSPGHENKFKRPSFVPDGDRPDLASPTHARSKKPAATPASVGPATSFTPSVAASPVQRAPPANNPPSTTSAPPATQSDPPTALANTAARASARINGVPKMVSTTSSGLLLTERNQNSGEHRTTVRVAAGAGVKIRIEKGPAWLLGRRRNEAHEKRISQLESQLRSANNQISSLRTKLQTAPLLALANFEDDRMALQQENERLKVEVAALVGLVGEVGKWGEREEKMVLRLRRKISRLEAGLAARAILPAIASHSGLSSGFATHSTVLPPPIPDISELSRGDTLVGVEDFVAPSAINGERDVHREDASVKLDPQAIVEADDPAAAAILGILSLSKAPREVTPTASPTPQPVLSPELAMSQPLPVIPVELPQPQSHRPFDDSKEDEDDDFNDDQSTTRITLEERIKSMAIAVAERGVVTADFAARGSKIVDCIREDDHNTVEKWERAREVIEADMIPRPERKPRYASNLRVATVPSTPPRRGPIHQRSFEVQKTHARSEPARSSHRAASVTSNGSRVVPASGASAGPKLLYNPAHRPAQPQMGYFMDSDEESESFDRMKDRSDQDDVAQLGPLKKKHAVYSRGSRSGSPLPFSPPRNFAAMVSDEIEDSDGKMSAFRHTSQSQRELGDDMINSDADPLTHDEQSAIEILSTGGLNSPRVRKSSRVQDSSGVKSSKGNDMQVWYDDDSIDEAGSAHIKGDIISGDPVTDDEEVSNHRPTRSASRGIDMDEDDGGSDDQNSEGGDDEFRPNSSTKAASASGRSPARASRSSATGVAGSPESRNIFRCHRCGMAARNRKLLATHLHRNLCQSGPGKLRKSFWCPRCDMSFTRAHDLKRHNKRKHEGYNAEGVKEM